jgi:programmed cell death protein 4
MAFVPAALDENDPNYDDFAEDSKYILSSTHGAEDTGDDTRVDDRIVYGPTLTLSEFKIRVCDAIKEYFDSGDAHEVIRSIQEMRCKPYHSEVVKRAISLSLDEGPRERELVSRLLTSVHPYLLEDEDVEKGFEILLDSLEDLSIDIPDAKSMVGCFLARAIVDEVLPPAFISNRNNNNPGDEVTEKAVTLLSREHCTARLEKVWGPGDGRPVVELKEVIDQLVEEYLLSRELDEAARCVREMNAPHFHHELVKRGVKIAMEKDGLDHNDSGVSCLDAIAALFSFLVKNAILSEYQVSKGISRLHKVLSDIKLDVPAAPAMLEEFEEMAKEGGCLISA